MAAIMTGHHNYLKNKLQLVQFLFFTGDAITCDTVGGVCRRHRHPITRQRLVPLAQWLARCLRLCAHCPRANNPVLDGRVLGDRGAEVGMAAGVDAACARPSDRIPPPSLWTS